MAQHKPETTETARRQASLPLIALLVVACDLLGLYLYMGRRQFLLHPVWVYLFLYALSFGFYVYAALRLVPRIPPGQARHAVWLILAFAVLFRLVLLPAAPSLSTDMYRYVWDGRLTLHGINPYHYTPNNLDLGSQRDSIWANMEYRSYYTIYMPVSQVVFALANFLFGSSLTGYKLLYVLFDLGVMALLVRLLRDEGQPLSRVIWYAWCPLPITEIALAGHQDVVGVFFLLLAFRLVRRRQTLIPAALALVAAGLTKGFALTLLPLFCRTCGRRFTVSAIVGLVLLGMPVWDYLPNFLHGMKQYLVNVHVNGGLFHWISLALSPFSPHHHVDWTRWLSDAVIAAAALGLARRPADGFPDLLRRAYIIVAVTLLVVPTLFPWYLIWVLPFSVLIGRRAPRAFVALSGLVVLLYTYYLAILPIPWVPLVEYLPFYVFLAWESGLIRRPGAPLRRRAGFRLGEPGRSEPQPAPPPGLEV